jgi:effector-binding domain-containing protein
MVTIVKQGSTQENIDQLLAQLFERKKEKGISSQKYCGVLKLEEDALSIQKCLRNEWE